MTARSTVFSLTCWRPNSKLINPFLDRFANVYYSNAIPTIPSLNISLRRYPSWKKLLLIGASRYRRGLGYKRHAVLREEHLHIEAAGMMYQQANRSTPGSRLE